MQTVHAWRATPFALIAALIAGPALAKDERPRRVRVSLGAQIAPKFPGADEVRVAPFIDLDFARGDDPFPFEAPDDSFGFALVNRNGLTAGPALSVQGSRRNSDVGVPIGKVDTTFEAGAFVQYASPAGFRLRAEGRRGVGGHDGFAGNIGADIVMREGDNYVVSVGPRVTLTNGRYQRAFFGVNPAQSVQTGLPVYRPDGGVQAVGATAGLSLQFNRRWGMQAYAAYDRLVGDAADSPIVRRLGSRNQFAGGLALSYTFGGGS